MSPMQVPVRIRMHALYVYVAPREDQMTSSASSIIRASVFAKPKSVPAIAQTFPSRIVSRILPVATRQGDLGLSFSSVLLEVEFPGTPVAAGDTACGESPVRPIGVGILSGPVSQVPSYLSGDAASVSQQASGEAMQMDLLRCHRPVSDDGVPRRHCLSAMCLLPRERGKGGGWR